VREEKNMHKMEGKMVIIGNEKQNLNMKKKKKKK